MKIIKCDYFGCWPSGVDGKMTVGVFRDSYGKRGFNFPVRHMTAVGGNNFIFNTTKGRADLGLVIRRKQNRKGAGR